MSDYICIEIQAEIMKWLPVRSLIQYRLVSKEWKAIIESSEFITEYYLHNTQQQQMNLLVSYLDSPNLEKKYVSVVDDDTFPLQKFSVTVPVSIELLKKPTILTSQGLFCLYDFYDNFQTNTNVVVIWNPLITKYVDIQLPNVLATPYENVIGFYVRPKTTDIKLLKITYFPCDDQTRSFPWEVQVYSLSSKVWRYPLCSKLPLNSIELTPRQVDLDGVVYWLAYDHTAMEDDGFNLLMSFDTTSEEFIEVRLPHNLSLREEFVNLVISKLNESLVVFDFKLVDQGVCSVWMMEDCVPRSFTKLFTINMIDISIKGVHGFRMSGELVIQMMKKNSDGRCHELFVYEPYLQNIRAIDICGRAFPYFASSYPETLLLLDH